MFSMIKNNIYVRLTEVQEAQKQIINVARKLSDDGTIVLAGRGGEEMV